MSFLPPKSLMPALSQHQWEIRVPANLATPGLKTSVHCSAEFINSLKETSRGFFHLACDNVPQQEPQGRAKYLEVLL